MTGNHLFQGWGRAAGSIGTEVASDSLAAARKALVAADSRGLIARGLGRSYGDAAQNAGGSILDMTSFNTILAVDEALHSVTVEAGVSIDQLMRHLLPLGLWLPVLPGTRQVTIGGAIAADVHGKNHHRSGSFGSHVTSLDLLIANGDVVTLTPRDAAFWATVGGMGLTGIITQATIDLTSVESSYFVVDTLKVDHLDDLLAVLTTGDDDYEYSVAWFDTATRGKNLGRAVTTRGHPARLADLDPSRRARALELNAPQLGAVPFVFPNGVVNKFTARAFNAAWFTKAPRRRDGEVQDITQFFHPLDIIADWNRVYGPHGFCQYQFVVPFGAEEAFSDAVATIADSPHVSSLNVLKRFGQANESPLSFPMAGWTLAVDLPVRSGLANLLDRLDRIVLAAGGRVYLAKDSRLNAASFRTMYPRLDEFAIIREQLDPNGLFRSDLARRLEI